MNSDSPVVEPTPISRAERRRNARATAPAIDDTPGPEDAPEEGTENQEPRAAAITEVVSDYGQVVADMYRTRKIPHAIGAKLVEMVLQYDVQRRNLAIQEMVAIREMNPAFGIPPGAVPVTDEEIDQLQDGTHPDLQTPEEEK